MTPIAMKSTFPTGPLKTKLIIINYSNHDKKPIYKLILIILKDLKNSRDLKNWDVKNGSGYIGKKGNPIYDDIKKKQGFFKNQN